VSVPEGTPITRGGKKVGLETLQEGDPVTVQVARKEGRVVARTITVGPPGPAAAAPLPRDSVIPRVRLALKLVEQILGQMDKQGPPRR
jgi:hypothetical protein